MQSKLPCIEKKCMIFAACRNRERIICDDLYKYYGDHLFSKDDSAKIEFHNIFSNIIQLTADKHGFGYLFTPHDYTYQQMHNHLTNLTKDCTLPFKVIRSPKKGVPDVATQGSLQ